MKFIGQDLRYSLRVLLKSPGFTTIAVITLALGIGANVVVFGVMNALILHPLNVPHADRLYQVERGKDKAGNQSYPDYLDLRDRNRSFDDLEAYDGTVAGIDTGGDPSSAWVELVTGNYFDGLRLHPFLGRLFHAADERGADSAPYIVLTHAYWHSHFHDDPGVVGRVVQVNKHPFTIVGVAPIEFHGTIVFFSPDFFVPIVNQDQLENENDLDRRGKRWIFSVMGHLKEGVTPSQAIADLNSIGAELEKSYPNTDSDMTFALASPSLYGDEIGTPVKAFITGLMALAVMILLAACTNLGSLFAARAADRSREVALRIALGSSRSRILRQLLTEATLISLLGGAVGFTGSIVLLRALSKWQPFTRYPVHLQVNADVKVYGLALVLTLVSGLLFGAVPLRRVLRANPYDVIKAESSGRSGRWIPLRDLLLVAQIAICALLVTSSLVAVRGLMRAQNSNFGFEPQNVMLADVDLSMAGYSGDQIPAMQRRILEAMQALPGAETAGLVNPAPLYAGSAKSLVFTDRTADLKPVNAAAQTFVYKISPDYFHAAGTALLSGRDLTWHDDKGAPRVAVVNAEFARKVFGSPTGALGAHYKLPDGTRIEVVGIAEQGKYGSLAEEPKPAMFIPFLQSPSSETWVVVRSNRDPKQMGPAIISTIRNIDSGLPIYIQTWVKELDHPLFAPRMATYSLGALGLIAAMLCITGVFGTAAYTVSKRRRQIGIRMALGAQRVQVLQAALGRAFNMIFAGSAVGLILGLLASRVLASIVYQATSRDPLILVGVVVAMSLLGLIATWIPAQRALAVDPLILLREE
ncbi:MAG: ABC transporter permease [Terracidiphilus sp.]